MSKEIIEEDAIFEFEIISAKENHERYRLKSTFDHRKLQKNQNLNFDLKVPRKYICIKNIQSMNSKI